MKNQKDKNMIYFNGITVLIVCIFTIANILSNRKSTKSNNEIDKGLLNTTNSILELMSTLRGLNEKFEKAKRQKEYEEKLECNFTDLHYGHRHKAEQNDNACNTKPKF